MSRGKNSLLLEIDLLGIYTHALATASVPLSKTDDLDQRIRWGTTSRCVPSDCFLILEKWNGPLKIEVNFLSVYGGTKLFGTSGLCPGS